MHVPALGLGAGRGVRPTGLGVCNEEATTGRCSIRRGWPLAPEAPVGKCQWEWGTEEGLPGRLTSSLDSP